MTDAGFQKVTQSDNLLYGPRKLLLCGFPAGAQPKFIRLLKMIGLSEMPMVWVTEDQADNRLADLVQLEDGSGAGASSELPRAIIMSGISQMELHLLMSGCRKSGMRQPLWATLTPTSETWSIQNLLKELAAEHEAMKTSRQ
jgi:hypothetical protein